MFLLGGLKVSGTNVLAKWEKVTKTNDFIIYTDFQPIRKKGSKVNIWQLWTIKLKRLL